MSTPDPQLDSIRRTFDAATDRLYRAKTMQEAQDELSNVLHQLYRLGELCRWRLGQPPGTKLGEKEFHKLLTSSDELRIARAAMWARTFNTHDILMPATTTYDPFGRWMPFLYGTAFAPLAEPDKYGRDADYAKFLEGQLVVDTTRRAFAALAALL
jgi:hypothetical protein